MAHTIPGPKILKLASNEDLGKLTAVFTGDIRKMTPIGCDPLMLSVSSP